MSRDLEREVFNYCRETCPEVENAFHDTLKDLQGIVGPNNHDELQHLFDGLLKAVKEVGTEKLREALRSAVSDKRDAEAERDDCQGRVRDLERQIETLDSDFKSLERELEAMS